MVKEEGVKDASSNGTKCLRKWGSLSFKKLELRRRKGRWFLKCGGKKLVLEERLPSQRQVMRALLPGSFRE